jgi:hypothetical protein
MKEYQAARKNLESRRLAYDTTLAKLQKAKKEDFRVEEELRSQKAKYEEAEDDVHRRMEDIRDLDPESVMDLGSFLEAQLAYHDQCREALLQLKAEWPARQVPMQYNKVNVYTDVYSTQPRGGRSNTHTRSRSNTVRSYTYSVPEEPPPVERPSIKSNRAPSGRLGDIINQEFERTTSSRPQFGRSTTYDAPAMTRRDMSPAGSRPLSRVPSDTLMIRTGRNNMRNAQDQDVFADDSGYSNGSPDPSYGDASVSPATSTGSSAAALTKRAPPPPPPSRTKKPPPPPVPQKRTAYA